MISNTIRPSRRLLVAISGYLLIGFIALEVQPGSWAMPVAAMLLALYALLALRAAAPGLLQPKRSKHKTHPVESGKARLNKRERAAMLDSV
ncbi:hypothetical protein [Thiorhodococcus minor]|uniref:Uncharacterized protein n=1 Tax=Thiorhodococcus minor TaxID=57489 RepID=A0A6M0JVU2_9GAMM|nr:hypothetical protein [Thiorhodococcus minor]NEV60437.1 hypothetical protein [Thiorhodococcus minor]